MKTYCPLLFINKRIPFKKKSIAVALLFVGSSTISHAVEWEKEFVIESDVSWNEMVGGGGQAIHPNQKVTILNESTVRFDYKNELTSFGADSFIYGINMPQPPDEFYAGQVFVTGGYIRAIASAKTKISNGKTIHSYGITNGQNYKPSITVSNTGIEMHNYYTGIRIHNGALTINNLDHKEVYIDDTDYAITNSGTGSIDISGGNLRITNTNFGIYGYRNSHFKLNNNFTLFSNFDTALYLKDNHESSIESSDIKFEYGNCSIYASDYASFNLTANNLTVTNADIAKIRENATVTLRANETSALNGSLLADGGGYDSASTPASLTLTLKDSTNASFRNTPAHRLTGDAIAVNQGQVNLNLGRGSYWQGRSDDFKDADSDAWRKQHVSEFEESLGTSITSSGKVNVNMSEGSYWNVTGQSWVSKLDGNGTIDLRGSETGGYAIHVGEISGSNTFILSLDRENLSQSDMIYVYNGTGDFQQNVVISNRDEVLGSMEVGDRIRFATVANAGGGFVSEGMTTEFDGEAAASIGMFGSRMQMRDAGVNNVNFGIVYTPYEEDQTTAAEDEGYNGTKFDPEGKPGHDYIDQIYSEGENPYNVYIERLADTTPSDAADTIEDMSRANYAMAIYMDTLNKRMGEARFHGQEDDGWWIRVRHDRIGKKGAFRNVMTMAELGYDVKKPVDSGSVITGLAFDYMSGSVDYRSVDGDGDAERLGLWAHSTWLSDDGQYADFVLKFARLDNEFSYRALSTNELIRGDYHNNVFSVSGEYGMKFANDEGWFVEPQGQVQLAYVSGADYTTSQNTRVDLDSITSVIGRIGMRFGREFLHEKAPGSFYARADVLREFSGSQHIEATDPTGKMDVTYRNRDTWYSVGLGYSLKSSENSHFFVEAEHLFGADYQSSYTLAAGFQYRF